MRIGLGIWFFLMLNLSVSTAEDWGPVKPRLIFNTDGPVGATEGIAFSPDSRRMFIGGHDRCIHAWDISDTTRSPVYLKTLRWEFGRGHYGHVYALAISPDGKLLAAGGYGGRVAGQICLFDAQTMDVKRGLSAPESLDQGGSFDGHGDSIVSLSFSADGKRLASVSGDGEMRVWHVATGKFEVFRERSDAERPFGRWPCQWIGDRVALPVPVSEDRTEWHVGLFTGRNKYTLLPTPHYRFWGDASFWGDANEITQDQPAAVGCIDCWKNSNRWLSTSQNHQVFLWQGETLKQTIQLQPSEYPVDAVLCGTEYAAVLVQRQTKWSDPLHLQLWAFTEGRIVDEILVSPENLTVALGCTPDGKRLVVQDPSANIVKTFSLVSNNGERSIKPLSSPTALSSRSRGMDVWNVQFSTGSNSKIEVHTTPRPQNRQSFNKLAANAPSYTFDLKNLQYKFSSAVLPIHTRASTWEASLSADRLKVTLESAGVKRGVIELDTKLQGMANCSCLIRSENGVPYAIAIGTRSIAGIYIYSLPSAKRPPELLRWYRDHHGDVVSLDVSKDGRYLLSGGRDQLVKIWSLEGLQGGLGKFSKSRGWGADFVLRNGRLTITDLAKPGIMTSRNYQDGDVIEAIQIGDQGQIKTYADPAAILTALERRPLFHDVKFAFSRQGDMQDVSKVRPAWEPLMTLFVDRTGEWALFSPQGYYDASVAEGNELFGWQLNQGPHKPPRILKAAELEQEFEKPAVMKNLLRFGNLPDALSAAAVAIPPNLNKHVQAIAEKLPEVHIRRPLSEQVFDADTPIAVEVTVDFPEGVDRSTYRVRGHINGIPLQAPRERWNAATRQLSVSWTTNAADEINRIHVIAEQPNSGPNSLMSSKEVVVMAEKESEQRRLHLLVIGGMGYADVWGEPLKYTVRDANAISQKLEQHEGVHYTIASVRRLVGKTDVTAAKVKQALKDVSAELQSANEQDVLFIFVAGHGKAWGPNYFFITSDVEDTVRPIVEQQAVAWTAFRGLADLPCRKVIMIDTCMSGNITISEADEAASRNDQMKAASRPLKRDGFMILMSTGLYAPADESSAYGGGHGSFTYSVLLAFEGAADSAKADLGNADGDVSLMEVAKFVRQNVPRLNPIQKPTFTPTKQFEAADPLKLIRYR